MADAILYDDTLQFLLASSNSDQIFDRLIVRTQEDSATLVLMPGISIDPADYSVIFGSENRLRSFDDIANRVRAGDLRAGDRVLARVSRLREELARPVLAGKNVQTFFGLNGSELQNDIKLQLELPFLMPGGDKLARFQAWASLATNFDLSQLKVPGANFTGTVPGRLDIEVRIQVGPGELKELAAALRPVAQNLGTLLPDLPEISMPKLSFHDIDLGEFPAFRLPFPEALGDYFDDLDLRTEWFGKTGSAKIQGGKLSLEFTAETVFTKVAWRTSDILTATTSKFSLVFENGKLILSSGDVEIKPADVEVDHKAGFGGDRFPLEGEITLATVKDVVWSEPTLTATWEISRLYLQVTDDPGTRIAVKFDIVTQVTNGKVSTRFVKPGLLDLSGKIDIPSHLPSLPDDLISLPFCLPNDNKVLGELLDRLSRILSALLDYVARAAGAVAKLVSDLARSLSEILSDLMEKLLKALTEEDVLVIDLRLDAKTLRPVQLIVTDARLPTAQGRSLEGPDKLFKLSLNDSARPAVAFDFRTGWAGLILLNAQGGSDPDRPDIVMETDLWFAPDSGPVTSVGQVSEKAEPPLLRIEGLLNAAQNSCVILAALQDGQVVFFRKLSVTLSESIIYNTATVNTVSDLGTLQKITSDDLTVTVLADRLKDKVLSLLPSAPQIDENGLIGSLSQRIVVTAVTPMEMADDKIKIELGVMIIVGEKDNGLKLETTLVLAVDLRTLRADLSGDRVAIKSQTGAALETPAFGLALKVIPNKEKNLFILSFADGNPRIELAGGATMEVIYSRLSTTGRGLVLKADSFGIGHGGLDLVATAEPEHPVRLAGVDQPFRFTSGAIRIESGELIGGSLSGYGPLPPALIGEAIAEVTLTFGAKGGGFKVVSAKAKLEKRGEPLYSTGTRFRVVLDKIEIDYRDVDSGGEHFFFLLWGEAAFDPAPGEFASGLMKNLRSVAIRLDGAPLTGNASELLKHISFLVEIDPPFQARLFETFVFECRAFIFRSHCDAWPDEPPAIGLNGQVFLTGSYDIVQAAIDCHEVLITYPDDKSPLPRLRADGMSVLLNIGGLARVEATAVAVDDTIPSLYAPVKLPANVTANGFLASGRVEIAGLGAYGAAMGFLELRKEGASKTKHAMFLYAQGEKLAERIDTPCGPIYMREIGAGLGANMTLPSIAAADQASSPRELVRSVDEISKYQGNLMSHKSWIPQFEKDALTLALRGMISLTSGSQNSSSYNASLEETIANPLLMDIVLALRTDLTFFANVRGWIAVNYHDWINDMVAAPWKEQPTMRGYLYFSVPRREFLARFIADGTGHIGEHPALDENLKRAIQASRFAATLYIRPGLYHMEWGWPYELGFDMGKRGNDFWMSVSGGMIFRIEEATALFGIAFKAIGEINFTGGAGAWEFGAAVTARATFALGAKFIAYLAPIKPRDTIFYGEVFLSITVKFGVSVWLGIRIGKFKKRFSISFSIMLTVSVAAEIVLGPDAVGARVYAAVGVRGFGRTITVGVGFSFGDRTLDQARARVARFMALGLGVDVPKGDVLHHPAPVPEPSRQQRAETADTHLDHRRPIPTVPGYDDDETPDTSTIRVPGDSIGVTHFWALLQQLGPIAKDKSIEEDDLGEYEYIMQLLPKDLSKVGLSKDVPSTFFAEPFNFAVDEEREFAKDEHEKTADYLLKAPELPKYILKDGGWELTKPLGDPAHLKVHGDLGHQVEDGLNLNTVLAECFLAGPSGNTAGILSFGEPLPFEFVNPSPPGQTTEAVGVEQQSSRLQVGEGAENVLKKLASLNANERRSALVGKIGDSLRDLAERARAPGFAGDWEGSAVGLDARHFGLTFRVTAKQVNDWFGTPEAKKQELEIKKRVRGSDSGGKPTWQWTVWTKVELLLHPDQTFEKKPPQLRDRKVVQTTRGLDLMWDLDSEFGSGEMLDFDKDPETHLDYYLIERSFEGIEFNWSYRFRTRTCTRLEFKEQEGAIRVTRERAQVHLNDDLSMGGVPEDFRALILGTPIPSGRSRLEVWNEVVLGREKIAVNYKVIAVDEMGTQSPLRVVEHEVARPADILETPVSAGLTVYFPERLPAANVNELDGPRLSLELVFADRAACELAAKARYLVRIRRVALRGGGQYGIDAVDDARSAPGAAAIDIDRPGSDTDLALIPTGETVKDNEPVPEDRIEVAFRFGDAESKVKPTVLYRLADAGSLADSADASPSKDVAELARALGMIGWYDGQARRVFLQRNEWDCRVEKVVKGAWTTVATQLRIRAVAQGGTGYNAMVEMLERPVALDFPALDRRRMRRNAGRLDLLLPAPDATLNIFADELEDIPGRQAVELLQRRADPELRSAVELEIDVHGADHPSGFDGAPLTKWTEVIGGLDVFTLDPARLRLTADRRGFSSGPDALKRAAAELAQRKATLKVLPRSLAGRFPESVPDFKTLAPHYPSLSRLTDPARRGGRREAPWYSGAESLVAFPMARLRRWLIPSPAEPVISHLLDRFRAESLEIQISTVEKNHLEIDFAQVGFSIDTELWPDDFSKISDEGAVFYNSGDGVHRLKLTASESLKYGLQARHVRGALRSLRLGLPHYRNDADDKHWTALKAADVAYSRWRLGLTADRVARLEDELRNLDLQIKLTVTGPAQPLANLNAPPPMREETITVNLHSDLHPVLEDTLAALAYEPLDRHEDMANHPGHVYRAYEPVREPRPPVKIETGTKPPKDAKALEAFAEIFSESADPIGWGALRAMGLAEGLRLYNIETENYLAGPNLIVKVRGAFREAMRVYSPEREERPLDFAAALSDPRNLGSPFVELVDRADAYMAVSSFDGSDLVADEDFEALRKSSEQCIIQLSLRPRPAQQAVFAGDIGNTDNFLPYPVRYLVLRRNAEKLPEPRDIFEINLPSGWGFFVELVLGADLRNDTRPQRWMSRSLAALLYEEKLAGQVPEDHVILADEIGRARDLPENTVLGYIRLIGLGEIEAELYRPKQDDWIWYINKLNEALGSFASVGEANDLDYAFHPIHFGQQHQDESRKSPFDRFPLLAPEILGMLQLVDSRTVTAFDTLLQHLPPGLAPRLPRWPLTPGADDQQRQDAANLARRMASWTERFLRHGTGAYNGTEGGPSGEPDKTSNRRRIDFALIGLTTEDAMVRVPDANGVVRAFFIEPSRNGREMLFAVCPFGRYANIEAQLKGKVREPALTADALGGTAEDWRRRFLHVALPRTRPLDKPAILSVARIENETQAGEIELVVGRTADQMVGLGNLPAERALQPGWTGVELRASFPGLARAQKLFNNFDWKANALPDGDQAVSEAPLTGEIVTDDDLVQLRRRVPDAWRGSIRYGFRGLPHFLRVTALAHQSAGVVVSDPAGIVLPEAGSVLRLPPFELAGQTGDLRPAWGTTAPPTWTIIRRKTEEVEEDGVRTVRETVSLLFDLPLVRNLDLMPDVDLQALTAGKLGRAPAIYRLPDSKVSYQIALTALDRSSLLPQIEVLPTVEVGQNIHDKGPMYFASLPGRHFGGIGSVLAPLPVDKDGKRQVQADLKQTLNWRLRLEAVCKPAAWVAPLHEPLADLPVLARTGGAFDGPLTDFDARAWSDFAPRREITVRYGIITEELRKEARRAHNSLAQFEGDLGADAVRALMQNIEHFDIKNPTSIILVGGGEEKHHLPMGASAPADGDSLRFVDSDDFKPRYAENPPPHPAGLAAYFAQQTVIGKRYSNPTKQEAARAVVKDAFNYYHGRMHLEMMGRPLLSAPTQLAAQSLPFPFTIFDRRRFRPNDLSITDIHESLEILASAAVGAFESGSDIYLSQRIAELVRRTENAPAPAAEVVLSLPAELAEKTIEAKGWREEGVPKRHIGMHRLPSGPELRRLQKINPGAADEALGLIGAELLGPGGMRLTAFRKSARPVSTPIFPSADGGDT